MGNRIAVINYGVGNLMSVVRAFRNVGADVKLTNTFEDLDRADKIVLPGVGAFSQGMINLEKLDLVDPLHQFVVNEGKPFLGICLGFQLITRWSAEGQARGLGWVDAETVRFNHDEPGGRYRVPHLGWNEVRVTGNSPIFKGIGNNACFYFAHSYYVVCAHKDPIMSTTEYGCEFVSVFQHHHIYGTQFHPEKSHTNGLHLIKNFVALS